MLLDKSTVTIRQFAAAISNYGLIISSFRSVADSSVSFLFLFLYLIFICGSISRSLDFMEFPCISIRQRDMTTFDPLRSLLSLLLMVTLFATLTSSINAAVAGMFSIPSIFGHEPATESLSSTIKPFNITSSKKTVVRLL